AFRDKDGSVTGIAGAYVVNNIGVLGGIEACEVKPTWNAAVCTGDLGRMNVGAQGGGFGRGFGAGPGRGGAGGPGAAGAARGAAGPGAAGPARGAAGPGAAGGPPRGAAAPAAPP